MQSVRIHMKEQIFFSKKNLAGKHIENSVISKYVFTLPTYTFVCASIIYLYKLF